MATANYTKIDAYGPLRLRAGAGGDYKNGLCVMETVAWLASEDATDKPECACPVLGAFAIGLNDKLNDTNRQQLLPLALPMTGTRSAEHEQARAEYIVMRVIREIVPVALRAIGLNDHADAMASVENLEQARAAADAAYAAAYAAADAAAYAARAAALAAALAIATRAAADAAAEQELLLKCIPILQGAIELGPNAADQWPALKPRTQELADFAAAHLVRA